MAEESFGERTERATPKRRQEARKKGQVVKSREIPSVMILMAGLSILFFCGSYIYQQLSVLMVQSLRRMGTFSAQPDNLQALMRELIWTFFLIVAPVLFAVVVVSILGHYVQVGTLFSLELVKPNFSKINPFKGFGRIFSKQAWVELLKSFFKILIVGWVGFSTIQKELPNILPLVDQDIGTIFRYISSISLSLVLKAGFVMILVAGLDYIFQRWSYEKSLRMTKQEVKEEFKQIEGDPLIRSRIRSIQREMAKKRMMAEVPKADVIVTNPVHLAVALGYKNGEMEAPKVVAKGAGLIAEKIKEIGRNHQIPIIENKPLAQLLFKTVDLGEMIPSTLYQAVADILAYVYRIKNKTF